MTEVQVWLPFAYSVTFREPRRRNSTSRTVRDEAPFMIRHIPADQASPVALVTPASPERKARNEDHHTANIYTTSGAQVRIPQATLRLVAIDGELYRPIIMPDGDEFTVSGFETARALQDFSHENSRDKDYPFTGSDYEAPFRKPTRAEIEPQIHEFQGDTRREALAKAHAVAASLVMVGDVLMQPAALPVIEIVPDGTAVIGGVRKKGSVLRVLATGVEAAERASILFSIGEIEEAQALVDQIASALGAGVILDGSIEPSGPSPISEDLFGASVSRFERSLRYSIGPSAHAHPTAMVRLWCDARDHFDAYQSGRATGLADAAAAALEATQVATEGRSRDLIALSGHASRVQDMAIRLETSMNADEKSLAAAF